MRVHTDIKGIFPKSSRRASLELTEESAIIMVLSILTTTLAFSLHAAPRSPIAAATHRLPMPHMGLFDGLAKAFENKDYSQSPGTYEQTNARASHILVATEEQASKIKDQIATGELDFSEAAVKFSTCASASRGGASMSPIAHPHKR